MDAQAEDGKAKKEAPAKAASDWNPHVNAKGAYVCVCVAAVRGVSSVGAECGGCERACASQPASEA
eukprot:95678-Chlamydomonas_euryale.AAC.5